VSAGKQKRRGTRKGDTVLKAALVTAAVSAPQAKGTYLGDKFHRLKARMGTKKAASTGSDTTSCFGPKLPHSYCHAAIPFRSRDPT
jgi:hypothetical protein